MILKPSHLLVAMIAIVASPVFAQTSVNGKPIPSAKIDRYVKAELATGKVADTPQLREEVTRKLVLIELLRQEAEKQGYGVRTDVKDAVENQRQTIMINAMMIDFAAKVRPTDAEYKAEYDAILAKFGNTEYHARHILVATEDDAKAAIVKLKGGAKFEDLAKQISTDKASAPNGGDLGWSLPGHYLPDFAKAMVAMKAGTTSEVPVKSTVGFHVIKLEESRPAPKIETVKPQLLNAIKLRKAQEFRDELRKKAVVK
jgi:peptidyl-prolyl cis-trans isomerase C